MRRTGKRQPQLAPLAGYAPVGESLVAFWLEPGNRANETWTGHRDINEVMLATALLPGGYLDS